jgi:hypothetical protein
MADQLMMFFGPSTLPDDDHLVYDPAVGPVPHGSTFTLDDAQQAALLPYVGPYLKEVTTDYTGVSRVDLEQAARDAGIQNPEDLETYPHEGSLAAAIENLKAGPPHVVPVQFVSAEEQIGAQAEAVSAESEVPVEPTPEEGGE